MHVSSEALNLVLLFLLESWHHSVHIKPLASQHVVCVWLSLSFPDEIAISIGYSNRNCCPELMKRMKWVSKSLVRKQEHPMVKLHLHSSMEKTLRWFYGGDIFCIEKGTNPCKTNVDIQAEGVVSPSGTINACCTSKTQPSCTHRPTEIKPQSRDWDLLPMSSLQLIKTAPTKMTANARKKWGWLHSRKGWGQAAVDKEVSRSQKETTLR